MPLRGRATARNCSALPGCLCSHIGSCSLEGPLVPRGNEFLFEVSCPLFQAGEAGLGDRELTSLQAQMQSATSTAVSLLHLKFGYKETACSLARFPL
jgi:hypothetical protein